MKNGTSREALTSVREKMFWKTKHTTVVRKVFAIIAVMMGLSLYSGNAQAVLPPMNLGETSFNDGVAFPGLLIEDAIAYYYANQMNDSQGDKKAGTNKLITVSNNFHVAYITKYKLLGGYYGIEALLPLADVDLTVNTPGGPVQDRERGFGDLTISPLILQWNDHKLFGMPYFHRFVVDITLPTGAYDQNHMVNAGSNLVTVEPYYAFTIMPIDKMEFSARLHYQWNSENDKSSNPAFSKVQPGQVFHANYAASYEVLDINHLGKLRFGLNGYALQQLTDEKHNGASVSDTKERVFGIGPGIQLSNKGTSIYINGYFETGAENRAEGAKIQFRISQGF